MTKCVKKHHLLQPDTRQKRNMGKKRYWSDRHRVFAGQNTPRGRRKGEVVCVRNFWKYKIRDETRRGERFHSGDSKQNPNQTTQGGIKEGHVRKGHVTLRLRKIDGVCMILCLNAFT